MAGWFISASAFRSVAKRREDGIGVHATLDEFQGDLPPKRGVLFGEEHLAHAALAEQCRQAVGADLRRDTRAGYQVRGLRGRAVCVPLLGHVVRGRGVVRLVARCGVQGV